MTRLRSVAWRRLQEVFDAAADLDPAARPAFLDEQCAGDPGLRQQVESLLLHVDGGDEPLQAVVEGAMEYAAEALTPSLVGARIGRYRLEREIGEGGMGTVYLAVRADDEYQQRVAVKLLRSGMLGTEMRTRFRSERQILARLDHPNIARLFDGGTTDAGAPYLVMEYVDGQPITTWCKERDLSIADRLKLFRDVCAAVQYAHAHLVVHRDLKPTNILVTADGTPKLLDFGIAKILMDEAELGNDHPRTLNSIHVLGGLLDEKGQYMEAEALLREALVQRRRVLGPTHPATASTINNLASLLHDKAELDAAEPLYREALAAQRARLGDEHMDVAISLNNLASLLESRGDGAAAEKLYRQSLAIREKRLGPRNAAVARARHNLGRVLIALGRTAEGERYLRASLEVRRALLGNDHPDVAVSLMALAALAHERRDLATAEALYWEAVAIREKKIGAANPQTAVARSLLGAVLVDRGAAADAEPLLRDAVGILKAAFAADHVDVARAELAFGRCLAALGRRQEAVALVRHARDSFTTRLGAGSRPARDAVKALAAIEPARR